MNVKAKKPFGLWFETSVLVIILVVVGWYAGRASFTHVHDWTMRHSPSGTEDWFGWANAVISELVPVAAMLAIRRRRRDGESIAYPMFLLCAALVVSVTAQLSEAKPGFWGGVVSVLPALAFAALAKLILGRAKKVGQTTDAEPVMPVSGERVYIPPDDLTAQPQLSNGHRDRTSLIGPVTR